MYSCRDIPDVASDFISRDGSKRTRLMVALHLAGCSQCRTYVRGLKTARRITAESLRGHVDHALFVHLGISHLDREAPFKEPNE